MRQAALLSAALLIFTGLGATQTRMGGSAPAPPPAAAPGTSATAAAPTNGITPASVTGSEAPPAANTGTVAGTVVGPAASSPATTGTPMPPADTQPVVNSTGVPVNGSTGFAGGGVVYGPAAGGRLISTPTIDLSATNPAAGASNATAGLQAGATNATLAPTVEPNTATIPQVPAAYSDFGPAGVSSAWTVSGVGTQDVAMAARQAKARKAMDHPRLFTNEDLARLNQGGGMQTGVSSSIVTNPSTMPGSDINAQPQQNVQPPAQQPQAQQNNATQPRSPFQPKTQAPQSPQSPK